MKWRSNIKFLLIAILLAVLSIDFADSKDCNCECKNEKIVNCTNQFPRWLDWRTDAAKCHKNRKRLTEDPFRTTLVVFAAILVIFLNALLCHLLFWDEAFWGQRTYRIMFSLAVNDCITGILLIVGVLTEMESVADLVHKTSCKIVIAGLWLCVTTSIYTFTVISIARWLILNHNTFYKENVEKKPMWKVHLAIFVCWLAGACHAIPLLTPWNNDCVTDFNTCSLPYKSPLWIWGSAIFVFFLPSLVIVIVYTLILLKLQADRHVNMAAGYQVTKTMSLLTAAFLLCWWPLGIQRPKTPGGMVA